MTLPSLDKLKVDGVSHITRAFGLPAPLPPSSPHHLTNFPDSQFKKAFETYLSTLKTSKVRTLHETMQFMTEHADLELPPSQ